jgi:putative FmdB family regulatory protein
MPIYEYRCGACGHTLDALQKVSDPKLTDCPACSEAALRRLISAPAFRLKGGGWYETDFKSDKEKKRNLVEQKSDGGESKSDGGAAKDGKSSGDGTKPSSDGPKSETKAKKAGGSGSEAA